MAPGVSSATMTVPREEKQPVPHGRRRRAIKPGRSGATMCEPACARCRVSVCAVEHPDGLVALARSCECHQGRAVVHMIRTFKPKRLLLKAQPRCLSDITASAKKIPGSV